MFRALGILGLFLMAAWALLKLAVAAGLALVLAAGAVAFLACALVALVQEPFRRRREAQERRLYPFRIRVPVALPRDSRGPGAPR